MPPGTTRPSAAQPLVHRRPGRTRDGELIYIDATPLTESKLTGIARFVARLVEALLPRAPLRLFTNGSGHDILIEPETLPMADDGVDDFARKLLDQPK